MAIAIGRDGWRIIAFGAGMLLLGAAPVEEARLLGSVDASRILVISDGDYLSSTCADQKLPTAASGFRDRLTVLSKRGGRIVRGSLPVSNSVTAAPEVLALSPDGRTAFVTERLGERAAGARLVKDLPPGQRLFAIDLGDPVRPRLAATIRVGNNPEALAVDPTGARVALVTNDSRTSRVEIVAYRGGSFGPVAQFDLARLGVTGTSDAPRGGVTATNVQWHPSGRILAVNINSQDRVAFFQLQEGAGGVALVPWGAPVAVGRDPFVGRFTPDGGYYLTSNWGRNFAASDLEGRLTDRPSTLSLVRLGTVARPTHAVVQTIISGVSAEGLAVSPDGRWVATANMRGTVFPRRSPRYQRQASISLFRFDPTRGRLARVADTRFDAVLPEGLSFDTSGRHLLATSFERHAGGAVAGLQLFRVVDGARPTLVPAGRIAMPHGAHHVVIMR